MAQTTPSELAEMSLQQLFEQNIDEQSTVSQNASNWSFALQYKVAKFDGYLDGHEKLSFDDVLWEGPSEQRTNKNFPVLPTVISQRATLFSVGYQFNNDWRVHITLPYIYQSTEHISSVENYDYFVINSSGLGDIAFSASYRLFKYKSDVWWLTAGVSLPSGSIDEQGDTPRAEGDQVLPYTMQLGSVTYDFPFELSYQSHSKHDVLVSVSANIRTGRNNRNYRLGNNYKLSGRYRFATEFFIKPFVGLDLQHSEVINGRDESLLVPATFVYPASITNPDLYGGTKLSARVGISWQINKKHRMSVDFTKPLYQNLHGPQPKELWHSGIQISKVL
ncbi:MAG: hypothetical protein JKY14_01135 [Paraglaciecola sp.]|nr:hypothetical protein [Paraglaciecola sp.]